ncbi:MAG: hypothetical protein JXR63_09110 [Spirochaetales bacterium]|nr:hypothetical protein [Spirochaetales bacterium]
MKKVIVLVLSLVFFSCASTENFMEIRTPAPSDVPMINGAKVFGVRAGHPFFYKIPATGKGSLVYSVENLPVGLLVNSENGCITGSIDKDGEYQVVFVVKNSLGTAKREFKIIVGENIGLTPVMGWNSWYIWSESISQQKVIDAAKALVDTGLVNYGWSYINIDDCWQGVRGGENNAIQGNERFPDMKAMCATVHSMGVKVGLYSTPWIGSYAGFVGSTSDNPTGDVSAISVPMEQRNQEFQVFGRSPNVIELGYNRIGKYWLGDKDALQWGEWGIDLVKIDWNPIDIPTSKRFYNDLKASGRDIILSLSNNASLDIASELGTNADYWRISGDIEDEWGSINRIVKKGKKWKKFVGPSSYGDLDMLQVGKIGIPNTFVKETKPSRLTYEEQYSQVSYWTLMASPLILSCDLNDMDEFTLNLLTNREIIEISQDELGLMADFVVDNPFVRVLVKPLYDGSYAIGIFNRLNSSKKVTFDFSDGELPSSLSLRDVWRQKDLGVFHDSIEVSLMAHGSIVLRAYKN